MFSSCSNLFLLSDYTLYSFSIISCPKYNVAVHLDLDIYTASMNAKKYEITFKLKKLSYIHSEFHMGQNIEDLARISIRGQHNHANVSLEQPCSQYYNTKELERQLHNIFKLLIIQSFLTIKNFTVTNQDIQSISTLNLYIITYTVLSICTLHF